MFSFFSDLTISIRYVLSNTLCISMKHVKACLSNSFICACVLIPIVRSTVLKGDYRLCAAEQHTLPSTTLTDHEDSTDVPKFCNLRQVRYYLFELFTFICITLDCK